MATGPLLKASAGHWAQQAAPWGEHEYGGKVWWHRLAEGGLEHRESGCSRLLILGLCLPGRDVDLHPERQLSLEQLEESFRLRQEGRLLGYPDQLLAKLGWSQASSAWLGNGVGWLYPAGRLRGGW